MGARERSAGVNLFAKVRQYMADMRSAADATDKVATAAEKATKATQQIGKGSVGGGLKSQLAQASTYIGKHSEDLNRAGSTMVRTGGAITAVLALAGKAAIDWESDWAGVAKTVDGTAEQMATLQAGLRGMAKEIPASTSEIAAVAEAAGQLGVKTENVQAFTRTMIDLGETTNLSADQAATSLAQLMSIMQTDPANIHRLGSAIVDLGNNGASTEADIVSMAQRIAASASLVGMSETDVLGFSSALASVGVEAEAGGTAISQSFRQIDNAVRSGGAKLDTIARTAGMSADQFRQAWGKDAAGATVQFVEGLKRVSDSGGDAVGILNSLGMTGIRQSDSLLRLAGAGDLLSESLKTSANAWQQDTALTKEAATRYATAASQIQIAWNRVKDAMISVGGVVAPIIASLAGLAGRAADAFATLSPGMQKLITYGAGVSGAGLLMAGGLLKGVVAAQELAKALGSIKGMNFSALAGGMRGLVASMGGLAAAGSVAGIALAGIGAALVIHAQRSATAKARVAELTGIIREQGAVLGENSRMWASKSLQDSGVYDSARRLGLNLKQVTDAALGQAEAIAAVNKAMDAYMSNSRANQGADAGKGYTKDRRAEADVRSAIGGMNEDVAKAVGAYKNLSDAQGTAADSASKGAGAQKTLGDATSAAGDAAATSAQDQTKLATAIQQTANAALQASGSAIGYQSALREAAKAAKENGKNLDITTEKGAANRQALDSVASSALSLAQALSASGASTEAISKALSTGSADFVKVAMSMGMTRDAAQKLAEQYGLMPGAVLTDVKAQGLQETVADAISARQALENLPATVSTTISTPGSGAAIQSVGGFSAALAKVPGKKATNVSVPGATKSKAQVDAHTKSVRSIPSKKSTTVTAPGATDAKAKLDATARSARGIPSSATVRVQAIGASAVLSTLGGVGAALSALNGRTATTYVNQVRRNTTTNTVNTVYTTSGGKSMTASANGNLFLRAFANGTEKHVAQIAPGGSWRVWAEPETEGEAYIPLAKSKRGRSMAILEQVAAMFGKRLESFASGGVSPSSLSGSGASQVWAMIRALSAPLSDLARLVREQAAAARAAAPLIRPRDSAKRTLDRENATLKRIKDSNAGEDKRYAELIAAAVAKKDSKRASALRAAKAKNDTAQVKEEQAQQNKVNKAKDAYNKALDKSKAATDKLNDATQKLRDAQQEMATTARDASTQLWESYSTATEWRDWLDQMREGTAEVNDMNAKVAKLRQMGLTESAVQQIIAQGPARAAEIAADAIAGGKGAIQALNAAATALQRATDTFGAGQAIAVQRKAAGGIVIGPGGPKDDRIPALLSNREFVMPADATAKNLRLLELIRSGAVVTELAGGGMVGSAVPASALRINYDTAALSEAIRQGLAASRVQIAIDGMSGLVDARIVNVQRAQDRRLRTQGVAR